MLKNSAFIFPSIKIRTIGALNVELIGNEAFEGLSYQLVYCNSF